MARVRHDIQEIEIESAAGEYPDGRAIQFRIVARILERLPRTFEQDAVLRVHDLGLARRKTKERRIEHVGVFEYASGLDVVWVGQHVLAYARFD